MASDACRVVADSQAANGQVTLNSLSEDEIVLMEQAIQSAYCSNMPDDAQ